MNLFTGLGELKLDPEVISPGTIIMFHGTQAPSGWSLCDGTNGTPDLRDRFIIGASVVSTGTPGGTMSPTSITHAGFALGDHTSHIPTQPSAHTSHTPTQPAAHSSHIPTQPGTHPAHANNVSHTHDNHTLTTVGSAAVAGAKLTGPQPHTVNAPHSHDNHPAHSTFNVSTHSLHSAFNVSTHSLHTTFNVSVHSTHVETQPSAHAYKHYLLGYLMKI